jgi:hypothetical protein
MSMTRDEHVQWAKDRALAELSAPGPVGVGNAMSSVISDLNKHPETSGHGAIELMMMLALGGHMQTEAQVREFIDGIN